MMGLRMDDIHTPTVPSGPTTSYASSNGPSQNKQSLMDLMAEKDRVEGELTALSSVLDSVRRTAAAGACCQIALLIARYSMGSI